MNELEPLRVVSEIPPDLAHLPVFECYGDPDDHLRLSVLIASSFEQNAKGVGLMNEVEACRDPASSWSRRLQAVDHLLREARPRQGGHLGILFDLDALDPGPIDARTRWDDREFRGARRELFNRLEQALPRGGWLVVRPNPSADVASPVELAARSAGSLTAADVIARLAPECRPVAEWIVREGVLAPSQICRRFSIAEEDPAALGEHLVSVVYDALTEGAAQAALRISLVRPPQSYNGMLGAFELSDATTVDLLAPIYEEDHHLLRRGVAELVACGFLQQTTRKGHVRMPRAVRSFLEQRASAVYPEVTGALHRWLASPEFEENDPAQQTESHFHAVQVSPALPPDIERAKNTARYYASALREMAVRLSVEQERFSDAASLFEGIVKKDPTDAYAWEYLGFNLARSYRDKPIPPAEAARIEEAYSNATIYNPGNPLYEGRLIGFLARMGQPTVEGDFSRRLRAYLEPGAAPEGVSYFAKTALDGMPPEQRRKVVARWRKQLAPYEELAPYLSEAA